MEYIAIAKNVKISPRKMRLVVDSVKKNNLKGVLTSLAILHKRAALPLKKTLDSAISNAVNNFKAEKDGLSIKDIIVTEGAAMKRFHFAARGRVHPYKKRTSHIRVILTDNKVKAQTSEVKTENEQVKSLGAGNPPSRKASEDKGGKE